MVQIWLGKTVECLRNIVFSYEATFRLDTTRNKVIVYRRKGEKNLKDNIVSTKDHYGPKIDMWCCFSYYGVGCIYFTKENFNAGVYKQILANKLYQSIQRMNGI